MYTEAFVSHQCTPQRCGHYVTSSLSDIQRSTGAARTTIRYWLKRLRLGTKIDGQHHLTADELQQLQRSITPGRNTTGRRAA